MWVIYNDRNIVTQMSENNGTHLHTGIYVNWKGDKLQLDRDIVEAKKKRNKKEQKGNEKDKNSVCYTIPDRGWFFFSPSVLLSSRLGNHYSYSPHSKINENIRQVLITMCISYVGGKIHRKT